MSKYRKLKSLKFLYEIDSTGELRNVKSKKVVKGYVEKNGYVRVRIENKCLGGVVRTTIHRLVAEAFIPNPENKPEVNHIDSNRSNNDVSNLEWVTSSENTIHAINNGRLAAWGNASKPIIATELSTGKTIHYNTISQAERALNTRHITDVLKGKRNSAKGYTFEYQKEVI